MLEVHWPSGAVDKFGNLAADHYYAVLEGRGIVPAESIRPKLSVHSAGPRP